MNNKEKKLSILEQINKDFEITNSSKNSLSKEMIERSNESRDNILNSWIVDLVDPKDEDCCEEDDDCSTCDC